MQGKRKPGRPKGSQTKSEVVGRRRARKYFDLLFDMGIPSTKAAKNVAQEFGVETADIFAAVRRNKAFLAAELSREADAIERENQEMRAAIEMGPRKLTGRGYCLHLVREALKGNTK